MFNNKAKTDWSTRNLLKIINASNFYRNYEYVTESRLAFLSIDNVVIVEIMMIIASELLWLFVEVVKQNYIKQHTATYYITGGIICYCKVEGGGIICNGNYL